MKKIALVTGATSGFGKACAEKYSANGYDVIITGRRKDRLDKIQSDLEKNFSNKVLALCFDVQDKKQVFDAFEDLPKEWRAIHVLVNNAGLAAGRDLFDQASLDDWETMINTNVKGLLYVSRAVMPFVIAAKGHIVNMGSVAGKEVYERGSVYCGTKHAVDAISLGMRIDLLSHQVRVTAIHPGAADTEFSLVRFKGDKAQADKVYEGYEALTAENVADVIFYCTSLPPHVCINDLVITPTAQATALYFYKDKV